MNPPSPPLSIYQLPLFDFSTDGYHQRQRQRHSRRNQHHGSNQRPLSSSTFSTISTSNFSTLSGGTDTTLRSQPPTSYYSRSRSEGIISTLRLFAPPASSFLIHKNPTESPKVDQRPLRTSSPVSNISRDMSASTASSPPLQPQPKKTSFFRRLSVSSSQPSLGSSSKQSPFNHPQPPLPKKSVLRSASGPYKRNEDIAGPAYESLPPGAAPSSFGGNKIGGTGSGFVNGVGGGGMGMSQGAMGQNGHHTNQSESRNRSKSQDRNLLSRERGNHQHPQSQHLPPTINGNPAYKSPDHTPIAAQFTRSPVSISSSQPSIPIDPRQSHQSFVANSPISSPSHGQPGGTRIEDDRNQGPPTPSKNRSVGEYTLPTQNGVHMGNGHEMQSRRTPVEGSQRQGRQSLGPSSIAIPSPVTVEVIASSNPRTPLARSNQISPHPSSSSPMRQSLTTSASRERFPRSDTLSRFEDADGGIEHLHTNGSPTPLSKTPYRQPSGTFPIESPTRPLISGRRSNSTTRAPRVSLSRDGQETPRAHPSAVVFSSNGMTSPNKVETPKGNTSAAIEASYFVRPNSSPATDRQTEAMTEASAYARAIAPNLARSHTPPGLSRPQTTERRVSRPLPQPPRSSSVQSLAQSPPTKPFPNSTLSTSMSNMSLAEKKPKQVSPRNTMLIIASNDGSGRRGSSTSIDSVTRRSVGRKDSNESTRDRRTSQSSDKRRPKITIPQAESPTRSNKLTLVIEDEKRSSSVDFDFPRTATLPALHDPRDRDDLPRHLPDYPSASHPIEKWANEISTPEASPKTTTSLDTASLLSHLPPRMSSASQGRRVASSPLASPVFSTDGKVTSSPIQFQSFQPTNRSVSAQARPPPIHTRPSQSQLINSQSQVYPPMQVTRPKGPPTLTYLVSHPRIASSLLPFLTINSFLSLMGYTDDVRKQFTGEMVGRWVMKEWGVQVEKERGRTWPGLTVWEGFLESLLHDPSGYSTYSEQYHPLLQHLCLSHTLIVLHLRQLPPSSLPNPAPAFDDEPVNPSLPYSNSIASMSSIGGYVPPRSRVGSVAGSDAGSFAPGRMPKTERLIEIVMPAPLSSEPQEELISPPDLNRKPRRRGSIGSIASVTSFAFGRKRANSTATGIDSLPSAAVAAAPMPQGKAALPPVSFPTAKRYGFRAHGDPSSARSRTSSESGRPGSIFSVQSSPSMSYHQRMSTAYSSRGSFAVDRNAPPVPVFPAGLPMPPPIGGNGSTGGLRSHRASFASTSDAGRSSRRSEHGSHSPVYGRLGSGSPNLRNTLPPRVEMAFEKPPPYTSGRAPILRVFVPLSEQMTRWPSAEGAFFAVRELEKCGALKRLRLGDLVVNTAIRQPQTTEHILVFVPTVKHLLVPLEYTHSPTGYIPHYVDSFTLPPSYYYPFLPAPHIVHLNLAPFAIPGQQSMRLAHDRRDVTVASGARLSAKRYLHVAGFTIQKGDKTVHGTLICPEWEGMVSLESEGTQEGKVEMEARFGNGDPRRAVTGAWEIVREKCVGTVWLRLVKEIVAPNMNL